MQIGGMMQNVAFDNDTIAKAALKDLFNAKAEGRSSLQLGQRLVDPQAVHFAYVGQAPEPRAR
jgi:hypothetical protein